MKELIILIIGAGIGSAVVYYLVTRNKKSRSDNESPHMPDSPQEPTKKRIPERKETLNNEFFRLSYLDNYLHHYNLNNMRDDSFADLMKYLLNDGKKTSLKLLQNEISVNTDPNHLLRFYNNLLNTDLILDIQYSKEDLTSPKVFRSGCSAFFKKYNLDESARLDLRNAVAILITKQYNQGKLYALDSLSVDFDWLKKNIEEQRSQSNVKLIDELKNKINILLLNN